MKRKIFHGENTDVYPGIVARNNAVLEYEKFIHRTFYPYIIHPHSHFRVIWEKVVMILIPLRLVAGSLLWAAFLHDSLIYQLSLLSFQIISVADVVMNFFTGYVESETEIAVLDPRRIAFKYLTTYFFLDFLSCVPFEFLYKTSKVCQEKAYETCEFVLDIFSHVSYLRYFCFLKYYHHLAKIMLWNIFLVELVCVSLGVFFAVLLANDIYLILTVMYGRDKRQSFNDGAETFQIFANNVLRYLDDFAILLLDCLYFENKHSNRYVYIRTFVLITSFFSNIMFTAFFIKYVMLKMTTTEKFLDLESRVLTFVRTKHLPRVLENKALLYFQIILENKAYREDEMFNCIPDTFKADIFFHLCLPLIKHFYAFEDLPTYISRRIAECMRYQLHLPNEIVMSKDDQKLCMYFVHRGTVALYSSKNVELYHFEGGSSFNGRNLILGEFVAGYYAISIEVAEVYRLYEEDFVEIMKMYPTAYRGIRQKVLEDRATDSYIL